jgi:hypothetical protein
MLKEKGGLAISESPEPLVPIGSRSTGVSLQPAIPRRVAPNRARFGFTHTQGMMGTFVNAIFPTRVIL